MARGMGGKAWREGWAVRRGERDGWEGVVRGMGGKAW